jgi:hypothetical protein
MIWYFMKNKYIKIGEKIDRVDHFFQFLKHRVV